jgi:hypothetical protein
VQATAPWRQPSTPPATIGTPVTAMSGRITRG